MNSWGKVIKITLFNYKWHHGWNQQAHVLSFSYFLNVPLTDRHTRPDTRTPSLLPRPCVWLTVGMGPSLVHKQHRSLFPIYLFLMTSEKKFLWGYGMSFSFSSNSALKHLVFCEFSIKLLTYHVLIFYFHVLYKCSEFMTTFYFSNVTTFIHFIVHSLHVSWAPIINLDVMLSTACRIVTKSVLERVEICKITNKSITLCYHLTSNYI